MALPAKYINLLTHISLWAVFLGVPLLLEPTPASGNPGFSKIPPPEIRHLLGFTLNCFLVCFFYLNYAFLLPRFYLRNKTMQYFLSILFVYGVFQLFVALLRDFVLSETGSPDEIQVITRLSHVITSSFFLLVWGASSGFRLGEEWRRTEHLRRETESRRLEAELALLKSQINPHFLLNTLNNLYVLALTAPEKTPDALLKLSEMVQYILHECAQPKVPLGNDLHFIENYIALQRLRLPPNVNLKVELPDATGFTGQIEPMILIAFIENAFKHGLTTQQPCEIFMSIKLKKNELTLSVENDFFPSRNDKSGNPPGIGLANTRQRLSNAYPEKHQLQIENMAGKHRVELKIEL